MSTNDILCELHAALVAKARERCRVEGDNRTALEIAGALIDYGKLWSEAFANDGVMDDAEELAIIAKGDEIIRNKVPSIENSGVKIAWNGLSLFGIGWSGLKAKLREWFGLSLACLALACVSCGCAYKGGKVVDGTNLAVGITVPGTEWHINVLDYVGGVRVACNDMTFIVVTNDVAETNRYFGVVETNRRTKMTAVIRPCGSETNAVGRAGT